MSLDWNVGNIKNKDEICWEDGKLSLVTESIIFGTMAVGIGQITEKNACEFFSRINLVERLTGPFMTGPDGPYEITMIDIKNHIGLSTNVSPETRPAWLKRYVGYDLDQGVRRYNVGMEELV